MSDTYVQSDFQSVAGRFIHSACLSHINFPVTDILYPFPVFPPNLVGLPIS